MKLDSQALKSLLDSLSQDRRAVVLTGGANAGKTTTLTELAKLGFQTIDEQATKLIQEKGPDIRLNLNSFVRDIWNRQFLDEASCRCRSSLTVTDRGFYDQVTYYKMENEEMPEDILSTLHQLELSGPIYARAFVLEPLPVWHNNGIRFEAEGLAFSRQFTKLVAEVYEQHGVPTMSVPVMPLPERLSMILAELAEHQLA